MGLYIKGMEMPNNCGACPLRLAWCRERIYMVTRPERCSLVPVPPHGRLIDAEALMPDAQHKGKYDVVNAFDISNAPTILEAEVE